MRHLLFQSLFISEQTINILIDVVIVRGSQQLDGLLKRIGLVFGFCFVITRVDCHESVPCAREMGDIYAFRLTIFGDVCAAICA